MLPKEAIYYFCKPDIPRGLEAESLRQQAESIGIAWGSYFHR
jgi:dihydrofolate synthase/folylpolyglutamate synthase